MDPMVLVSSSAQTEKSHSAKRQSYSLFMATIRSLQFEALRREWRAHKGEEMPTRPQRPAKVSNKAKVHLNRVKPPTIPAVFNYAAPKIRNYQGHFLPSPREGEGECDP